MTIITKVFCDTLEIDDPISFYTTDVNQSLINMVKRKYNKRCYMSSYINNITKIVRRSSCVLNQNGINNNASNPVSGFITVEFEAECIVYLKGEIITGCKVVKTDRYNNLLCDINNAGIYIESNQKNASIADGQIISIVVDVVVYDVLQEKMSISGSLFIPTPLLIAYEIQPKAEKDYIPGIKTMLASLDDISAISGTNNWKSFAALIYPHKNKGDIPKQSVKNMLDIIREDISPIASATNAAPTAKYIIRDSKLDLTTPNVYYAENPPDDSTVITLPIDSVWIALIENYRNYTNFIKGMIQSYGNAEVLQKHKNLWQLYGLNRV